MRRMKNKRDLVSVPVLWLGQAMTNVRGIAHVLDMIHLRPFPGGLVDETHPFCTGLGADGTPIWWSNVIYRSPGSAGGRTRGASDRDVVRRVGHHLRAMARRAASTPEFPEGMPSRMPAAILYLHGAVHHNAGWLLFDDFADAIRHFTDRRFAREFRRFIREERREPLIVFRTREYDRAEFGRFTCFMRSRFPWFANANGPLEPVLWGNPAPHPTVNVITGNWIRDTRALLTEEGRRAAPRPPIATRWFSEGPYSGRRETARGLEILLARFTAWRVRSRGAKGNLYFVDKEALAKGGRYVGSRFLPRGAQREEGRAA